MNKLVDPNYWHCNDYYFLVANKILASIVKGYSSRIKSTKEQELIIPSEAYSFYIVKLEKIVLVLGSVTLVIIVGLLVYFLFKKEKKI